MEIDKVSLNPTLGGYAVYSDGVFIGRISQASGLWKYQRSLVKSALTGAYANRDEAVRALVEEYESERKAFNEEVKQAAEQSAVDHIDSVTVDIPLFIRLLEFAREEAKDDMILHEMTQNMLRLQQSVEVLGMDNYKDIIGDYKGKEEGVGADLSPDDTGSPRTHKDYRDLSRDARVDVED